MARDVKMIGVSELDFFSIPECKFMSEELLFAAQFG
jgi:hypothetical protein